MVTEPAPKKNQNFRGIYLGAKLQNGVLLDRGLRSGLVRWIHFLRWRASYKLLSHKKNKIQKKSLEKKNFFF